MKANSPKYDPSIFQANFCIKKECGENAFSFSPHSVLLKWLMNQKTAGERESLRAYPSIQMAKKGHTNPLCGKFMNHISFFPIPNHLIEVHVPPMDRSVRDRFCPRKLVAGDFPLSNAKIGIMDSYCGFLLQKERREFYWIRRNSILVGYFCTLYLYHYFSLYRGILDDI